MARESPAANSEPGAATPNRRLRNILRTPTRKAFAAVGLGFAGALGAGTYAVIEHATESGTKKVFSSRSAPISVRVARVGSFFAAHPYAPYFVIPDDRVRGPSSLTPAEMKRRAHMNDFRDVSWDQAHGGVAGSPQVIRLELRGKSDEPVTVTNIRVNIVSRTSPIKGWYIASPACGADVVRVANIDLDRPAHPVVYTNGSAIAKRLALFVTRTDSEQIELQASTRRSTVAWKAVVFYSGPDGDGTAPVDDSGKPFRVTSEIGSRGYRPDFTNFEQPTVRREHRWDKGLGAC
jgi:hypothetical protein